MNDPKSPDPTPDLFEQPTRARGMAGPHPWPDPARFPLNATGSSVHARIKADLAGSANPLIVTAYTALDYLIEQLPDLDADGPVRILLGTEPTVGHATRIRPGRTDFPTEIREYWLARGVSLRLSARVIRFIEALRAGRIEARYLERDGRRAHAKIYLGDRAVTAGSSNFSKSGLVQQHETNVRFDARRDPRRYQELANIAENFWALGTDYTAGLIALAEQLLQQVDWRESLARACVELLEGEWAQAFLPATDPAGETLWPHQRQGIAQALYILDRQGSVLVADATGSGKTRLGTRLVHAIQSRMAGIQRGGAGRSSMVCPAAVRDVWLDEALDANCHLDVHSHSLLSHTGAREHQRTISSLRRTQLLCVDESHNFLNLASNRTSHLLRNMADHVVLFTATPINRSTQDLLRTADLLGADNLSERTLEAFERLLNVRRIDRGLTNEEIAELRAEIQQFTVRRTKRMINAQVEREPEAYTADNGRRHGFPRHDSHVYDLDEPERDRRLAREIKELADRLTAVHHFRRPLELPASLARRGWTPQQYLERRMLGARRLARYAVMAALRSSRVALIDHLIGTRAAATEMGLDEHAGGPETGDTLGRLERVGGQIPENRLGIDLPDWLTDPDAHAAACAEDHALYAGILERVRAMTPARERAKAKHLVQLAERHELLLGFDRRPITLAAIAREIAALPDSPAVEIATGDPRSRASRAEVLRRFAPDARGSGATIALCSDSMAEGINLQRASALVHLDLPSVVRIAEQRAGRVDRMDSPHDAIEIGWPRDAPEFALTSDDRLVERFDAVESLLGSNFPLPDALFGESGRTVDPDELIEEYESGRGERWDGIEDAFAPVRELVDGESALLDGATYRAARGERTGARAVISAVPAATPWAFFCLAGSAEHAPRWILLARDRDGPTSDLGEIATELRTRLAAVEDGTPIDATASAALEQWSTRLAHAERSLLPRRMQRALQEMESVLDHWIHAAGARRDRQRLDGYRDLQHLLQAHTSGQMPDWEEIAGRWLELIRPLWYEQLNTTRRRRPLLLRDIRREVIAHEPTLGPRLIEAFHRDPVGIQATPDERITAAIVGVTHTDTNE
ncbi:MAG: SNF2-related protein [Halofilum sp. (in: g-proteobacteria)]|nr:SNF2-related protein [Halofilum sp. (in: g-proteobacteria)]